MAPASLTDTLRGGWKAAWPEFLLMLMVMAGLAHVVWFFRVHHYLPQPFTYDTNNTFWDYVIPAYWSRHGGAYDVWQSIYPPISFVFTRVFSLGRCYQNPAQDVFWANAYTTLARCDWVAQATVIALYFLNVFLTFRALNKAHPRAAIARTAAIACSIPMLFAVERGNLILVCYTFFVLGYGRILKSAWARALCMAASINFKPYMAMTIAPLLANRRFRWVEGCAIGTVFVYLVTLILFGSGTPAELIRNQLDWVRNTSGDDWWSIYFSTTLNSLVHAVKGDYPVLAFVDSRRLEWFALLTPVVIHLGQACVFAAFFAAWLRPGAVQDAKLGALGLTLVLTASNPGGYVSLFMIFLIFLCPWRGVASGIAIICCYVLLVPYDYILVGLRDIPQPSWLGNNFVETDFGLSVGHFARPALILVAQFATSIDIIQAAVQRPRVTSEFAADMRGAEAAT